MPTKVAAFVDGENLVFGYQAMLKGNRTPYGTVVHEPGVFVWSPRITGMLQCDVERVTYYTSAVAGHDVIEAHRKKISDTRYYARGGSMADSSLQIIPRVFKRESDKKTRVVDIEITIDVMRALQMPYDAILLITGDGDFESLVHQVARTTSKQVFVAALSRGLSPRLPTSVDRFMNLDDAFFEPSNPA